MTPVRYHARRLLPDSKKQIADIIAEHGDEFQVYGSLTNRIASPHQRPGKFSDDTDIMNHKEIAMRLQREKYLDVEETVINIAGFLMIFKKMTWEKYRFSDNSIRFDSEFTNKVMAGGGRLGVMQGGICVSRLSAWAQRPSAIYWPPGLISFH